MKMYVGVTDKNWFELLKSEKRDEVNFWTPGARNFKALQPNELFLFKLHKPDDYIVGGGYFVRSTVLPTYLAWEIFGVKNGTHSLAELNNRIAKYRSRNNIADSNPQIGCIILTEPFFLKRSEWIPAPENWNYSIVQGKTYTTDEPIGLRMYQDVTNRLSAYYSLLSGKRYSTGVTKHRLGQGAFRVLVTDAYQRRCAVTGERTLPVLQAAHIKPYSQNVEWKESWQDDYLKWICGYANASGGTLYIGIDDRGNVKGINNSKKLLEKIPNQVTDTMGIIVDVNLCNKDGLDYLEIVVDKYPTMISYHGVYYYRSGSTMRTITGKELDRAILRSQGRTWDGMPVPRLKVEDLSQSAIALFKKKAIGRGRLTEEETNVSDQVLMENLRLYDDDGYLTRAAALAFYPDPERWITGAYIKIGFFGESDSDLLYQDEIHGPLIEQIDKAMDLIYTKYMKALITYQGIQRIERFFFHPDSCREILLNAVIHKAYESCNPIQISVYEDHMYVWNEGKMPEELDSTEKLFEKHSSKPYNPKLANTFFKSGMIEAWGRGFDKIRRGCEEYGGSLPKYEFSGGIMVLCNACDLYLRLMRVNDGKATPNEDGTGQASPGGLSEKLSDKEIELLKLLAEDPVCTTSKLAEELNVSRVTVTKRLRSLKDKGVIVRIGSDRKGYWKVLE